MIALAPAKKSIALPTIDSLLAEQQSMSAVERFARDHDTTPVQARYYESLLPATPPGPGQQYAFEVDLDSCSGCKGCVTACHSLNGLDDDETFRDVGLLIGNFFDDQPMMQHVTTACHHCVEPACMHGCPVNAYEKDPITGIVKHLDDQCIGCQYCTLSCPYGVPKYHHKKGIVRKCDMCSDRLSGGEAPACVQACPHQAISIRLINKQDIINDSASNRFVPGAHDPQYTLPTTSYKSRRALPPNLMPADYYRAEPEHGHWPLVVMLVLTQLSAGAFIVEFFTTGRMFQTIHAIVAVLIGLLALNASVFHLGRPLLGYRAVLGLRRSWLSREILAFSTFAPLSIAYAGSLVWFGQSQLTTMLGIAVGAMGAIGVFCSIMIYVVTQRAFWAFRLTATKFIGTALILGLATGLLTSLLTAVWSDSVSLSQVMLAHGRVMCMVLIGATIAKLFFELSLFRHRLEHSHSPLQRTAKLMEGPLAGATMARFASGFLGGIWMPTMMLLISPERLESAPIVLTAGLLATFTACVMGEILERFLFFCAVVASKMPGGPSV